MFPLAKGVAAVGRTWIPDQVIWSISPLLFALTLIVMALVLTVAVEEASVRRVPFGPEAFDTVAVTGLAGFEKKPAGAWRGSGPVSKGPGAGFLKVGPGKSG